MRVGIISINMYSKYLNFACPLHTFAFQQFLLQNGIDSTVINYQPIYFNGFDMENPYQYYKQSLKLLRKEKIKNEKKIIDYTKKVKQWKKIVKERYIRYHKFQEFIDTHYKKTEFCYNSAYLETMPLDFDCYICATDVIWKVEPHEGFDRGFFLGSTCMEGKKKISYAASRGVGLAKTDSEKEDFFRYINDIDFISVREESLKKYIEENSKQVAMVVLDPVLLHTQDFWNSYVKKPKEEHYLFLYYVMEKATDTIEEAIQFALENHLKIIEVTDRPLKYGRVPKNSLVEHQYIYDIGLEEWLGYIKYADYIFTNSFHGCCFSLLFEKNFYVGKRNGDKVSHLLDMFSLSERYFNYDFDILRRNPSIDYTKVNQKMEKYRQLSSQFILNAIHSQSDKCQVDYDEMKQKQSYYLVYTNHYKCKLEEIEDYVLNNGKQKFAPNRFQHGKSRFLYWHLIVQIDKNLFYYSANREFIDVDKYQGEELYCAMEEDVIPYFTVHGLRKVIADAVWEK